MLHVQSYYAAEDDEHEEKLKKEMFVLFVLDTCMSSTLNKKKNCAILKGKK